MTNDRRQLEKLIRAHVPCVLIETFEEEYAFALSKEVANARQMDLRWWSADEGVREGFPGEPVIVANTMQPGPALYYLRRPEWRSLVVMFDLLAHLSDETTLRHLRAAIERFHKTGSTLILIDHRGQAPRVIDSYAARLELSLPDEAEIEAIVRETLRREREAGTLEVDIKKRHLDAIINNLRGLSRRQIEGIVIETIAEDRRFDDNALGEVVAAKRRALASDGVLEFIDVPANLEDVGGLERLKRWLAHRRKSFSRKAKEFGLGSPRGVLLLGVQGAGKSLCAKAIATAWDRPLLRLDPGVLYDRYIGESEKRLRDCLHQAERMAPIVLWVDEIEKGFASAASTSTDGGLSRRMFGSLLTWMQEHREPVFLVATANDIEALPPELLRKGRFDEIFFVDLPNEPVRQQIAEIHLRKRGRDASKFDLPSIAAATEGYSGAEIEQSVVSALHECYNANCELTTEAVVKAARGSPPLSVTAAEKIAALRAWAHDRTVPAD